MSAERRDTLASLLFQLSACTDISEIQQTIKGIAVDPCAVIANIPETIGVEGFPELLRSTAETYGIDVLEDKKWQAACVSRAEAIDKWTGKLGLVQEWLQVSISLTPKNNTADIQRALRNASLLHRLIVISESPNVKSLEDLDNMDLDVYISWLITFVDTTDSLLAIDVLVDADDTFKDGWNAWWKENLTAYPILLPKLVARYMLGLFTPRLVLSFIYTIGSGCCELSGATVAVRRLAELLGQFDPSLISPSDNVLFPPDLASQLQDASSDAVHVFDSIPDSQLCDIVSVALTQVNSLETLASFGLYIDMAYIVACQGNADEQRRVLLRLLTSAQNSKIIPTNDIKETLLTLHDIKLFEDISVSELLQELLKSLLREEKYTEAKELILTESGTRLDLDIAKQAVCDVARELFDNADSGNMDAGLVKAAYDCIMILPSNILRDPLVAHELSLIQTAHLIWTLQSSDLSIFKKQTQSLIHPIEIRLSPDPYSLVKLVLERNTGGYKKARLVREIANKLIEPNPTLILSPSLSARRDLGIKTISDAFIAALLLDSAIDQGDYSVAYEFSRQLYNARSILLRAVKSNELYSSQLLVVKSQKDADRPLEVRAIECVWVSCLKLAKRWESVDASKKRLEAVSLVLSICPTGKISEILQEWSMIQDQVLTISGSHMGLVPWAKDVDYNEVPSLNEILLESSCADLADSLDRNLSSAIPVDYDAMCTFDSAIIKRALRIAARSKNPEQMRCDLLMRWLSFSLTTVKEPASAKDESFKQRIITDIIDKYPNEACNELATNVFPELDQSNYFALESFYSVYQMCLASAKSKDASQAAVRLNAVKGIQGVDSLTNIDFASILNAMLAPRGITKQALEGILTPHTISDIASLSSTLVELRPIIQLEQEHEPKSDKDLPYWSSDEFVSKLCLWTVEDILARSIFLPNSQNVIQQLTINLPVYVHQMDSRDSLILANLVIYDHDISEFLGLDYRIEIVSICREQISSSEEVQFRVANAYLSCLALLHKIRDPFVFSKLSDNWVKRFDPAINGSMPTDSCAETNERLSRILVDMVVSQQSAYFVSKSYVLANQLLASYGDTGSSSLFLKLLDIYNRALESLMEADNKDTAGSSLTNLIEAPLELSTFEYGDSELEAVLKSLKADLEPLISDLVYGKPNSSECILESTTRLDLLDIYCRYYHGSDAIISVERASQLWVQLIAHKLWNIEQVTDSMVQSAKGLVTVWNKLLDNTIPGSDDQIDGLIEIALRWTQDKCVSHADLESLWVNLLTWSISHACVGKIVQLVINNKETFTTNIGKHTFEPILGTIQMHTTSIPSLTLLGLAYPEQQWAERCMESLVYVMLSTPSDIENFENIRNDEDLLQSASAIDNSQQDDEGGWEIEDVELDTSDNPESQMDEPSQEEIISARKSILSSHALHLAIMIRGFVPACIASPSLFNSLETSILKKDYVAANDMVCQALLSLLPMRSIQDPSAELFRRTVHTLLDIGLDDNATTWLYEYYHVPPMSRQFGDRDVIEKLLDRLDREVLGDEYDDVINKEILSKAADIQKTAAITVDSSQRAVDMLGNDSASDAEVGWGEDESDIDLDLDLNKALDPGSGADIQEKTPVGSTPLANNYEVDAMWGEDDSDIDLESDLHSSLAEVNNKHKPDTQQTAPTIQASTAPDVTKTHSTSNEIPAMPWGEGGDDIDLESDLQNSLNSPQKKHGEINDKDTNSGVPTQEPKFTETAEDQNSKALSKAESTHMDDVEPAPGWGDADDDDIDLDDDLERL